MKRELTYNKWVKYIHDNQLNKYKVKYTQKPAEKSGAMLLDELREQEYIMRDNQIIAEFMGLELEETLKGIYVYAIKKVEGTDFFELKELKYHTSWDWLMPVIEKVNMVTKYDDYNQNRLHIQRVLNDCINENAVGIDEVCKAVVEFINEYNKRK